MIFGLSKSSVCSEKQLHNSRDRNLKIEKRSISEENLFQFRFYLYAKPRSLVN